MTPLELRLANSFLARALECPCPQLVPRSGAAGAKVKCFTIYIDKGGEPYLIVRSLSKGTLSCLEWTGSSFDKPVDVPLNVIESKDVSITHFYGYSEVQYHGVIDFALGRTLFLPYLKIRLVRAIEATDQYFFNKKKLLTKQRIDLLRFLVQRQLEGNPVSSPVDLMTGLYSVKWVLHPDRDPQQRRLHFYLDSLVDTGELRRRDHRYELTGEALKAIEVYEEQERKHTENVKVQRRMFWLTVAIVFLTGAQAGLYKLPTLLDLSDWKMGHNPSFEPTATGKPVSAAQLKR
ncbi:hypothetical protein [Kinneretia aquatilis]|uniref:hypothetical protein n=1 Tax=Kinneretia aquatilis TaxID=2070761 RepID=UPI0014952007|nr:hypothetical protein [Paucibacter aquatile]WIV98460.1 hypothetical protein K9V56_002815 [Paucibacter aquatile]